MKGVRLRPHRRFGTTVLGVVLAMTSMATLSPAGAAPATPARGCLWFGPAHSEGRFNVAFPDTGATYWTATMTVPVGAILTFEGQFPKARYMSFNAYDDQGRATSSLPDALIVPDRGSTNPFRAGGSRTTVRRNYSVNVIPRSPTRPMPHNTIEAGTGRQILFYRVYLPDRGTGLTGGVGLPGATLHLADGSVLRGPAACRAVGASRSAPPSQTFPRATYDALRSQAGRPSTFPAQDPAVFHRAFTLSSLVGCIYRSTCGGRPTVAPGQYSNLDSAYAVAMVTRAFRAGPVLVLTGTMPTTPATGPKVATMPKSAQLRYWSICQNESLATTRVASCLPDDAVPLGRGRRYTIVSSTPAARPSNAIRRCGVAWLAWPAAGDGAGHVADGLLIVRNMLPAASFHQSIQSVPRPGSERSVMGQFLPTGRYTTTSAFEDRGCHRHVAG